MYATTEGTTRYTDRFPQYRDAAFYRSVRGLQVSEPRHRHVSGRGRRRGGPRVHRGADCRRRRRHQPFRLRHQLSAAALGALHRGGAAATAARRDRGLHQGRVSDRGRDPRVPEAGTGGGAHALDGPRFLADQIDRSLRQPGSGHDRRVLSAQPRDAVGISVRARNSTSACGAPSRAWSNWWQRAGSAGMAPPPGTACA